MWGGSLVCFIEVVSRAGRPLSLSTRATDDRSRGVRLFLLHKNATLSSGLMTFSFLKRNGLLGNFLSWFRQKEIRTRYLFAQFYRLKDSKRAGFCDGRIVAKILK